MLFCKVFNQFDIRVFILANIISFGVGGGYLAGSLVR